MLLLFLTSIIPSSCKQLKEILQIVGQKKGGGAIFKRFGHQPTIGEPEWLSTKVAVTQAVKRDPEKQTNSVKIRVH